MTRWVLQIQYLANLLVGGTGIVYAVMRYFMEPADEWSVINHPWQPLVQHLHVLVAPLLVFACGLVWRNHVTQKWKQAESRQFSGHGMVLMLVPMVASGYLLQTSVSDGWRQAWIVVHLIASAAWVLSLLGHAVIPSLKKPWSALASETSVGSIPENDELES